MVVTWPNKSTAGNLVVVDNYGHQVKRRYDVAWASAMILTAWES